MHALIQAPPASLVLSAVYLYAYDRSPLSLSLPSLYPLPCPTLPNLAQFAFCYHFLAPPSTLKVAPLAVYLDDSRGANRSTQEALSYIKTYIGTMTVLLSFRR